MPVVPFSAPPTPAPPPVDQTFLELTAAKMHKEGKLKVSPNGKP
jgi:hypothetical protein